MDVRRPEKIVVEAWSLEGEPIRLDLDGLLSRVVQHEFDHLEGKLFVDYLSELKRNRIRKKLEKEKRSRPATPERVRTPAI
jgi:peptide deformylase